MLLILENQFKPKTPEDYDRLVSAEIPDKQKDPELYNTVTSCMIHGPCHVKKDCPYLDDDGKCTKGFPKQFSNETIASDDGFPLYRRRQSNRTVKVKGVTLDNRFVVPYNPELCKLFDAHINVEICNSVTAVKYLYKYVYKGYDSAYAEIKTNEVKKIKSLELLFEQISRCSYSKFSKIINV